jgi:hypothetical protein
VEEFFAAKEDNFSYAPGAAVCSPRASEASSFCAAASPIVGAVISGAEVVTPQSALHGAVLGFFDFFFEWVRVLLCGAGCAKALLVLPTKSEILRQSAAVRGEKTDGECWRQ